MTFVTKLRFSSGNRQTLERVVGDLKGLIGRKGAECKGPHADPPAEYRVPQYRTLVPDGDEFDPWRYTVYSRRIEIHGSERIARDVGHTEFPDDVRVEIAVERRRPVGSN